MSNVSRFLSGSRRGRTRALITVSALALSTLPVLALATSSAQATPTAPHRVSTAAPGDDLWSPIAGRVPGGADRFVNPARYSAFALDDAALDGKLSRAPQQDAGRAAPVTITVPAPSGELVDFAVVESPIMEAGLAAAHPDIKTYAGTAVGYGDSIRIDVSPYGFHASVRGDHGAWFVDPAFRESDGTYLSYLGRSLPEPEQALVEPELDEETQAEITDAGRVGEGPDALVRQRTYRLALLTDPAYAEYFAPGMNDGSQDSASNALVLAAKTTLMNRVNHIYGDDFGVTMLLIDDTDKLNLNNYGKATTAGGPCGNLPCYTPAQLDPAQTATNGCTSGILTRTRLVIGQLVGARNFDIGHIGLGIPGGGIASLGVVGANSKAQGCTGLPTPVGDFYAIDYVAHEMGHQFSGSHTFNGTQVNCSGGNRSGGTSVEPGSGSSVMAYAGICGSDDLQDHTDPYFSQRSQTEMGAYITSTLNNVNEVQSVGLTAFDGVDAFQLQFADGITPVIARGTNYNAVGIKAAIETVTGPGTATVVDYFGNNASTPSDNGFQVTYGLTRAGTDVSNPTVVPVAGTFVSMVNDIAQGGPAENSGFTNVESANHNPDVEAPAGKFIPLRTPFTLTGSATDSDDDDLVYLWEQNDRGGAAGTALTSQTKLNGPLFRVFGKYAAVSATDTLLYNSPGENLADGNPSRTFPDMDQVLAGETNAESGSCPNSNPTDTLPDGPELRCLSEFLPTTTYIGDGTAGNTEPSLNFRLTARDLGGVAGGFDWADTKLRIDKAAGPFLVTSQDTATSYPAGSTQTVTWDVNGTDAARLAPNVKVTMSTDGGETFDRVLAETTPNDGSVEVAVPDVETTEGRLKIEAVGNYFFDVNDGVITLVDDAAPDTTITAGPANDSVLVARESTFGVDSTEDGADLTCALDGAPVECADGTAELADLSSGTHTFEVTSSDGASNEDPTPAVRTFTVPVDNKELRATRPGWRRLASTRAFDGTIMVAQRAETELRYTVSNVRRLHLVASTKSDYGRVRIYLGSRLLAVRNLTSSTPQNKRAIRIAGFATPANGVVRIVTDSNRSVRIDGLAVTAAPPR